MSININALMTAAGLILLYLGMYIALQRQFLALLLFVNQHWLHKPTDLVQ